MFVKLLTTDDIRREYAYRHTKNSVDMNMLYQRLIDFDQLKAKDFSKEDRKLSLDDFAKRHGWRERNSQSAS